MSVGRSPESTRNLTFVKHILLWYVSPFFFILFWDLICTAVGPVHSRLRPGSAVEGKMQKTEWYGIEKIGGPSVNWGEGKDGFPLPRLFFSPIFFAFFPKCRAWSQATFFFLHKSTFCPYETSESTHQNVSPGWFIKVPSRRIQVNKHVVWKKLMSTLSCKSDVLVSYLFVS